MAFCPACGNQTGPDAQTCPGCGAGIDQSAGATAGAQPPVVTPPAGPVYSPPPPPPPGAAFAPPPPPGAAFSPPPGAGQMPPGAAWPAPVLVKKKTSGLAIASLVLAISGFVCLYIIGPIVGLILGIVAKSQIKKSGGQLEGGGLATAGIIISIIAIIVSILGGIFFGLFIYNAVKGPMDTTNQFIEYVNQGNTDAAYNLLAPGTITKSNFQDFVAEHKDTSRNPAPGYYAWSSNVENDRAEVTVRFTDSDGFDYEEVFQLRKVDGDWRITYAPDW